MTSTIWHIQNCSLFARLDDAQLERLERESRVRKFPKGAAVYLPHDSADGAFLLAEGRVRLCSTTPDGKQSILGFVEPGEVFGELALIDLGEREERAETILSSTIVLIPGRTLRELMEQSPQLSLGVTKLIGLRRKRVERRLRSLLFRNNRHRLAHLLIELSEKYGTATSDGIDLRIRLSHQELASIIGATRETVTTLLGEMQHEGLVRIRRQRLWLLDLPKLAAGLNDQRHAHPVSAASEPMSTTQRATETVAEDELSAAKFRALGSEPL